MRRALCLALAWAAGLHAGQWDTAALQRKLTELTRGFDGRAGVCARGAGGMACVHGSDRFSLQSVVKLLTGIAVLDAADAGRWKLADEVLIQRKDLSLAVQPLADLVGPAGFRTTLGDLVRRAIIQSDSAANDILMARLGAPAAVQAVLKRKGIRGIRVDRDERHLQTETMGLTWRDEFVDPSVLARAEKAVPAARRSRAYREYGTDPRDTATPEAMAQALMALSEGRLLTADSTAFVMRAMKDCATFPDRLKAGTPAGWEIAHKTGTSGSWRGVTVATNDVGILTAPDGGKVAVVVFLADSRAGAAQRAALMARVAAAVTAAYR